MRLYSLTETAERLREVDEESEGQEEAYCVRIARNLEEL
jgi:hypothetical protein